MKRYYIEAYCRVCDCEIATKKRPSEYGDYYLVTDVTRTMIPRPNAEEARKAVDTLLAEVMWMYEYKHNGHDDLVESQQDEVLDARAALLRHMGVENA